MGKKGNWKIWVLLFIVAVGVSYKGLSKINQEKSVDSGLNQKAEQPIGGRETSSNLIVKTIEENEITKEEVTSFVEEIEQEDQKVMPENLDDDNDAEIYEKLANLDLTWQLKTTTGKKYIIIGTDDDNYGNAKFFRLMRTYGFPYTMNVEAENVVGERNLGSDEDENLFSENDAPALFPDGVDVVTLGRYLHQNSLGEVALHGSSNNTLWDSERLTGSFLETVYAQYTEKGGKQPIENFSNSILEEKKNTDCAQGAYYVENAKKIVESSLGFKIKTVGIWGGAPEATVDGIAVSLNAIKGAGHAIWRQYGFLAAGSRLGAYKDFNSIYDISRGIYGTVSASISEIEKIAPDKVYEIFWHAPLQDIGMDELRKLFDYIFDLRKSGKAEVITRAQYAELGEYVPNPIVSLTMKRKQNLTIDETDIDAQYDVEVKYLDGTTEAPQSDVIIDRSCVDSTKAGVYEVTAFYRGFQASCEVAVFPKVSTLPEELKKEKSWFVYYNFSNDQMYCGNANVDIIKVFQSNGKLVFSGAETGKINGWKSEDFGNSWIQVTDGITSYKNMKTDGSANGFSFDTEAGDVFCFLESSFEVEME